MMYIHHGASCQQACEGSRRSGACSSLSMHIACQTLGPIPLHGTWLGQEAQGHTLTLEMHAILGEGVNQTPICNSTSTCNLQCISSKKPACSHSSRPHPCPKGLSLVLGRIASLVAMHSFPSLPQALPAKALGDIVRALSCPSIF